MTIQSLPLVGSADAATTYRNIAERINQLIRLIPLTGVVTFDFGLISSGNFASTSLTIPGAALGDVTAIGVDPLPTAGLIPIAVVTTQDTLSVGFINDNSVAINPPNSTFKVSVFKYI